MKITRPKIYLTNTATPTNHHKIPAHVGGRMIKAISPMSKRVAPKVMNDVMLDKKYGKPSNGIGVGY